MPSEPREPRPLPEDRLWNLADLTEFLGYETTATTLAAIKSDGIPHIVLGGDVITDRGAGKRVRFVPAQIHAWAVSAQKVVVKPAETMRGAAGPVGAGAGRCGMRPNVEPEWERAKQVGPRAFGRPRLEKPTKIGPLAVRDAERQRQRDFKAQAEKRSEPGQREDQ